MKLGRKKFIQFKNQHKLRKKIGGCSNDVISIFLYIVTVVKKQHFNKNKGVLLNSNHYAEIAYSLLLW